MIDLMAYLPELYENNVAMKELQGILSEFVTKFDDGRNEVLDNCFISTASKLLSRYEKIFGLNIDISKNDEFRRERLKAKVRGSGTTTNQLIEQVASSFSNGEVEVIEDSKNYTFYVKFIGTLGIPGNIADLKLTIEEIKPAHLAFDFIYTYNTWKVVETLTWEEVSAYTWEQIRTAKITQIPNTWNNTEKLRWIEAMQYTWGQIRRAKI